MSSRTRFTTADMAYIAMMAVIITLCAWISVPITPQVSFTMQTFAVFCSLGLLGGRRGSTAVLLYILMGAVGLPVFSGMAGGIGKLLGPTGGYILGFLFSALLYWLLERRAGRSALSLGLVLLLGNLVCYAFGTAWFLVVYSASRGPISLMSALSLCVFPFLLPDLIKLVLAVTLIRSLGPHLHLK